MLTAASRSLVHTDWGLALSAGLLAGRGTELLEQYAAQLVSWWTWPFEENSRLSIVNQ